MLLYDVSTLGALQFHWSFNVQTVTLCSNIIYNVSCPMLRQSDQNEYFVG
jgi:hypothetical protein